MKVHIIIYTRPECHLCDEARKAIDQANCAAYYTLEVVNIENDPELLKRYSHDIPVVTVNGVEAFRHRVDSAKFKEAILKTLH